MTKLKERYVTFAILGAMLCLAGGLALLAAQKPQIDEDTFCPLDGQYARTAILIDGTDPLSEEQINAVIGYFDGLRNDLQLHEWVGLFLMDEDLILPEPRVALCNPGNENTANQVHQNPRLLKLKFDKEFSAPIKAEVEKLKNLPEQSTSPIMEMVEEVVRGPHFPSGQKRRLIIVSDMLQNVSEYSQYNNHDDYDVWKNSEYARNMVQPGLLQGVDVGILYVVRKPDLQTLEHREFWRRYFEALGANFRILGRI